jgi:ribose transport system ATP-binding protein
VRRGEIVGLIGLVGAGRTLLAKTLVGLVRPEAGRILVNSTPVQIDNPMKAKQLGIAFIPEDRRAHGLVTLMGVRDNIVLPSLQEFVLSFGSLNATAGKYVSRLRVRTPALSTRVSQLSGGNQQKVVIAKWLHSDAKLLIFDEPTQGIDIGTKIQIYELMDELARQGAAILLITSDMREVLGLADRILVMRNGRLTGELSREDATQEQILRRAVVA